MDVISQFGFHESTVVRFCRYDSTLELTVEDVFVDGKKSQVTLMVSPVSSVMVDGERSDAPLMEASDGEILVLEISENSFSLIVEWNDFSRKKSFIKSYIVHGGKVSVSVI